MFRSFGRESRFAIDAPAPEGYLNSMIRTQPAVAAPPDRVVPAATERAPPPPEPWPVAALPLPSVVRAAPGGDDRAREVPPAVPGAGAGDVVADRARVGADRVDPGDPRGRRGAAG